MADTDTLIGSDSTAQTSEAEGRQSESLPLNDEKAEAQPVVQLGTKRKRRWREWLGRVDVRLGLITLVVSISVAGVVGWRLLAASKREVVAKPVARFAAVTEPFRVVSTSPSNGQTGIDPATAITITFNKPVDARTLKGDFFPSPQIDGVFSQGSSNSQVIFTPSAPFAASTIVKTMIHGEFASMSGQTLGKDYYFGFTTAIPEDQVTFSTGDTYPRLSALAAGSSLEFSIEAGQSVGTDGTVTTYRATLPNLLRALTYTETPNGPATVKEFVFTSVATVGMKTVATNQGFDKPIHFSQDPGIYVLVATKSGRQVGSTWVVVNNNGLIVRQDDQKLVAMAESLSDQTKATGTVDFYGLKQSAKLLKSAPIDGLQSYDLAGQDVDVAVGHFGDDVVVVPLSVPYSLGDMRLPADSGTAQQGTVITDRPTYAVGETVKFSGFVRQDNDAQYQLASVPQMQLHVQPLSGGDSLATVMATVDSHGVVSGQFATAANFLDTANGQKAAPFGIYDEHNKQLGTFSVVDSASSAVVTSVRFDKQDYLASDPIAATVSVQSNGQPAANASVTVNVYARTYHEDGENQSSGVGDQVGTADQKMTLDSQGQAKVTIDPTKLPGGSSQLVTVEAHSDNGATATGMADAIVHQGDGYLSFGVFRQVYGVGEPVMARVLAHSLDGKTLPHTDIHYQFISNGYDATAQKATHTTLAEGEVTTDETGMAEIHQPLDVTDGSSISLSVWMSDGHNNKIEASTYISVYKDVQARVYSQAQLLHFDVTGTTGTASVGDTLHLHITSPFAASVLATVERGRIYHQEVVALKSGDNSYDLPVEATYAPSFSLSFSYFHEGENITEGFMVKVPAQTGKAQVAAAMSKSDYQTSEAPKLGVVTKDKDGQPLSVSLVVRAVEQAVFSQQTVVGGDIFGDWYGLRERTVNESSSLAGIGSGGSGACGAGGDDLSYTADRTGKTLYFDATVRTDSQGQAQISLPAQSGQWQVEVYGASDASQVGQAITTYVVH